MCCYVLNETQRPILVSTSDREAMLISFVLMGACFQVDKGTLAHIVLTFRYFAMVPYLFFVMVARRNLMRVSNASCVTDEEV